MRWSAAGPLISLAGLGILALGATASEEFFFGVSQPIHIDAVPQFEIYEVTYRDHAGTPTPGVSVRYTCSPGCAIPGPNVLPSHANRNAANLAGVSLRMEGPLDYLEWKQSASERYVDTVDIWLDFTAARDSASRAVAGYPAEMESILVRNRVRIDAEHRERIQDGMVRAAERGRRWLSALGEATIECVLDNASKSKPPIRWLHLRTTGLPDSAWADTVVAVRSKRQSTFEY